MVSTAASWSELPPELLHSIGNRLENRTDVLRMRSVCSPWRSSIPPPFKTFPSLPATLFSHNPKSHHDRRLSFRLAGTTVYRLEPLHYPPNSPPPRAWLIKVSESVQPGETKTTLLLNPLSDEEIDPLPRSFPRIINLSHFRISELYHSNFVFPSNTQQTRANHVGKAVFLSDPTLTTAGLVAVVLHHTGELAAVSLGGEESTPLVYSGGDQYHDIINFNGKTYALDGKGRCLTVDTSLQMTEIASPLDSLGLNDKHMVESSGELLLVDRLSKLTRSEEAYLIYSRFATSPETGGWFKIYKLNEEEHKWDVVTNLGDRVLVVGTDCSFSVSAADFHGWDCKGNCIFYSDWYFYMGKCQDEYDALRGSGVELAVFNLKDGSVGLLLSYPGYADIFWPPPSWLAPSSPSSSSQS